MTAYHLIPFAFAAMSVAAVLSYSEWCKSPEECLQSLRDNLPRLIQEEIASLRESVADTLQRIDTLSAMLKD